MRRDLLMSSCESVDGVMTDIDKDKAELTVLYGCSSAGVKGILPYERTLYSDKMANDI